MKADLIAGVVLALIAGSARAEPAVAGQPVQVAQASETRGPAPAITKPSKPVTKTHATRPSSTPESRSAAALALSADPVFDEGTYQRIKEALLSYAAIQVRGGWPALPADAKLYLMTDREIFESSLPHLQRMFPEFSREWVIDFQSKPTSNSTFSRLFRKEIAWPRAGKSAANTMGC